MKCELLLKDKALQRAVMQPYSQHFAAVQYSEWERLLFAMVPCPTLAVLGYNCAKKGWGGGRKKEREKLIRHVAMNEGYIGQICCHWIGSHTHTKGIKPKLEWFYKHSIYYCKLLIYRTHQIGKIGLPWERIRRSASLPHRVKNN